MRDYHNGVIDILKTFLEYNLSLIPRSQNFMADSLATMASNFKIPIHSTKKFEIHVKHRSNILENLIYWQVFWDDKHINNFCRWKKIFLTHTLMKYTMKMIK